MISANQCLYKQQRIVSFSHATPQIVMDRLEELAVYEKGAKEFLEKIKKSYSMFGWNRVAYSNTYTIFKNTIKYIWLWSFEVLPWEPCRLTCDAVLIYRK